ncbi:MAG: nucleotide sugar dehydrogenase [Xanthomonadales bacterium]|uniref:UDP-glucose dehydrogenase family protein n=1 Tax=Hydrogenophaga sp. TaxID=1904254 RepID=UPI00169283C4|nr:UDP-glucose/GDP-mannose dehydrogenase family protein [Hydrogenophaga sp.]NIM71382.1 nucleotide sugar dehydrogenase [Xanthomonadales bacterium]NIN32301.1 nucleotide sugar dehydrogenase [Hydrogenophaga sp.]NIN60541.1 nucleotide sugar dehydrogenase [Xanthomonadales bacterium]NIN75893.1 nucleotide sugar dehydrogenase [Xanthomonadales bacterium]NIO13031.1 nucleotide sugar dehydrogenase [Xanthomonadales bacterium]
MRISIVGSGYVGLVSGAGLAEVGHHVLCMDIDAQRVERLARGEVPIYEPGLEELLLENMEQGRLAYTTSIAEAVEHAEVLMVAVGTPPEEDGSADLSHVLAVAGDVGAVMEQPLLIVVKSTVPVGTCARVRETVQKALDRRGVELGFSVASNPEFLAEGAAIANFMKPDRIVVGVEDENAEQTLRELYAPFNRNHEKLMCMDIRSAELTKYAANAMLATKISFMNELANIAERVGADIEQVRLGIGSDPRIGYHFIYPGAGYGGSCFPKDVRALARTAEQCGYRADILHAVEAVNERQKVKLFEKLDRHFGGDFEGRTVAVWGLSFKPNTDDLREASSLVLIDALLDAGAQVNAHDPKAMDETERLYEGQGRLLLFEDPYDAAEDADALVLVTEWRHFWAPDFERLYADMREPVLVDGRNIWSPEVVRQRGFTYYSIGRP